MGAVGILKTLGVGFFIRLRLRMSSWIIFYITLLNWEFLLKWYNFFWTFAETEISCCPPRFPLILIVKVHSLYAKESESGVGNFGKVGVGNLGSRSRKSRSWSRIFLPPIPQPWTQQWTAKWLYIANAVFRIVQNHGE